MDINLLLKARQFNEQVSEKLLYELKKISTTIDIKKDTYIFQEGEDAKHLFMVKEGLIQISKITVDGQELILRICRSDDFIGELTLFTDDPKYLLNAKVLKSGQILVINIDQLEEMLITNNNSELTFEMLKWMNNHMRKFQTKIRDLLLNGKKGALYSTLIRLSNSYGIIQDNGEILIDLKLTHEQLGKFCSATREYVSRTLADLRNNSILSTDPSGKLLIHDLEYLRIENGCDDCPIEICNIN